MNSVDKLVIRTYEAADENSVIELWALAFPNEPARNESTSLIKTKLTVQPELFFVAVLDNQVVGTVIAGFDGVRGWVHKVASHPDFRGQGIAARLMARAEDALRALGCKKLNLQVRDGNQLGNEFYTKMGFIEEKRTNFGKTL